MLRYRCIIIYVYILQYFVDFIKNKVNVKGSI